jgi:RNA polymerase sigma factor (sigma-70 family)
MSDADDIADSWDDREAFGVIFDRYFGLVYHYLGRRVGAVKAEDLAAEVFAVAFARRHSYDVSRPSCRPWLYGIAHNLAREELRTEQRKLLAYARTGVDPLVDSQAEQALDRALDRVEAATLLPVVADALAQLKQGDRDALLLYAWAGLSYQEVAEALTIPVGTIRSRLNRARRLFNRHLAAAGADPLDASVDGVFQCKN